MRHLFVSCAVVALMAAPALAQSTYETTEPLVETEESLDPTRNDQTETPTPIEQDAEIAPESEEVQAAGAAADEATFAGNTPPADDAVAPKAVAEAESFESPMNVAALPEEYSTADLNAMMLAQLNVVAVEIAGANAEAGNNVYASNETNVSAETDTAMTGSEQVEETATADNAPTEPMSGDTVVMSDGFAAVEPIDPALEAEADMPGAETGMMADATDDSVQMANQSGDQTVTAEGDMDQTAFEIAASEDRFSTLVELIGIAGLEGDLNLEGPYTVFAPTNDAFAALPEATLAHLRSDAGKAQLVEILQAHVAEGALMSGDVPMAGQAVETIGDKSHNVTGSIDGTLNVQGSHTIGEGIVASNGVVYAVDAVILPEVVPAGTES